ncbi:hypothetical protein KQI63_09640 [bacterium]|nr:hypothetical protein [bacterium]
MASSKRKAIRRKVLEVLRAADGLPKRIYGGRLSPTWYQHLPCCLVRIHTDDVGTIRRGPDTYEMNGRLELVFIDFDRTPDDDGQYDDLANDLDDYAASARVALLEDETLGGVVTDLVPAGSEELNDQTDLGEGLVAVGGLVARYQIEYDENRPQRERPEESFKSIDGTMQMNSSEDVADQGFKVEPQ